MQHTQHNKANILLENLWEYAKYIYICMFPVSMNVKYWKTKITYVSMDRKLMNSTGGHPYINQSKEEGKSVCNEVEYKNKWKKQAVAHSHFYKVKYLNDRGINIIM